MINTLIGTKKGMTSSYDSRGRRVGATIVELGPNFVTQVKTVEKDSYNAIQIGFGSKKSIRKPQLGLFKKSNIEKPLRWLKEVKVKTMQDDVAPGREIMVGDIFKVGDAVKVTGVTKGRGFQGGVKRYNFSGGPKTHGQSDRHRAPGSIGAGTTPGRVYKGKRMAGHMGNVNLSYRGLEVIGVDKANNLITLKGGVPGSIGGLVIIENIGKIRGYIPPPEEKIDEEVEESKDHEESVESGVASIEQSIDGTKNEGVENAS